MARRLGPNAAVAAALGGEAGLHFLCAVSRPTRIRSGRTFPIDPRQIEEDLTQLKPFTDCVRTYSIDHGLDQIPEIARRHGMKVMQGLWLSNLARSAAASRSTRRSRSPSAFPT